MLFSTAGNTRSCNLCASKQTQNYRAPAVVRIKDWSDHLCIYQDCKQSPKHSFSKQDRVLKVFAANTPNEEQVTKCVKKYSQFSSIPKEKKINLDLL